VSYLVRLDNKYLAMQMPCICSKGVHDNLAHLLWMRYKYFYISTCLNHICELEYLPENSAKAEELADLCCLRHDQSHESSKQVWKYLH
jgi:hypothetical protein